jgi:hypothetical protein
VGYLAEGVGYVLALLMLYSAAVSPKSPKNGSNALSYHKKKEDDQPKKRVMGDQVGVQYFTASEFIGMIRPKRVIQQIKVDIPRMRAYIDGNRMACARDLLLGLDALEIPQCHLFFLQSVFAPVINQLSTIKNGHVTDAKTHMRVDAYTCEQSLEITKAMHVYSRDLERKLGGLEISIYATTGGVWQLVEFCPG